MYTSSHFIAPQQKACIANHDKVPVMMFVGSLLSCFAVLGILQCIAGLVAARRFVTRRGPAQAEPVPITLLKPLCGDEPLLEEALASCCDQAYPHFQIVFGVQNPADPALAVVERLRARFPACDITIVADPALYGPNRKISNLINMLPAAKHDVLVFSDSDLHVGPDYLERLAAALGRSGTGLVSTLYLGLPSRSGCWERLAATQISHIFLPGVLLARAFGRQDCLGNTMILRRETLERVGGLGALVQELADDNVLGQLVRRLGLRVDLADIVTSVTVPEASASAMWRHELRWARTTRQLAPVGYAMSVLQYPIFWSLLAVLFSGGAAWSVALLALAWAARTGTVWGLERVLRPRLSRRPVPTPVWLLPLRDCLSIVQIVASYAGNLVVWRGHAFHAGTKLVPDSAD